MAPDIVADFARSCRGAMIAPAGCGKTWTIARAVTDHGRGRELVLTHTHAGVDAIRRRLLEFRCKPACVHVDTIAGWCLRLAAAFPRTSRISPLKPRTSDEYSEIYAAAATMLRVRPYREILKASYAGVYVDEYQDCTVEQHAVVVSLADNLPCRVIGDPLQSIFEFGNRPVVNWHNDVQPHFNQLLGPAEPHRWLKTNPDLGSWLLRVRPQLELGLPIDLAGSPVNWIGVSEPKCTQATQVKACFDAVGNDTASVIAIHNQPQQAYSIASRLRGTFSCVEVMDPEELYNAAERIDQSQGVARALAVLDFAERCMTKVKSEMEVQRKSLTNGRSTSSAKHVAQRQALDAVTVSGSPESISHALEALREIPGVIVYRRELFDEMQCACRALAEQEAGTLADAAWIVRNRTRQRGRRFARCAMGTTLGVKGLEFDHAIVLDPSKYDARNLYVALTRGSKSVTVVSATATITPKPTVQQAARSCAGQNSNE